MKCRFLKIANTVLLSVLGLSPSFAGEVECPSLSLKKVYDKAGLCDGAVADTASSRLREALLKLGDPRIGAENCYIPEWASATSQVVDAVLTYTFNYRLLNSDNQVLADACEAQLVVADASKPSCPSSPLNLVVPVGTDCIAIAEEAVDFFEHDVEMDEKGRKPACEGAALFADISAFEYYDEETQDIKHGGIFPDKTYDFNWDTSVPVLYKVAANSEFKNPNYCRAFVHVKDDVEIACPENNGVTIKTGVDGYAVLPAASLIAPVACNVGAVRVSYTLETLSGAGDPEPVSLEELTIRHFETGSYLVNALFSREATAYQTASSKTCAQTIVVADATKPDCPTISTKGLSLVNTVCSLDLAGVGQLVVSELAKDKRLDNSDSNEELTIAGVSGDAEIVAEATPVVHSYVFKIADRAGNERTCDLKLSLVDDQVPSCTPVADINSVLTDGCVATESVEMSGLDNCGIKKVIWRLDANQWKAKNGAVCQMELTNLAPGEHTLSWRLMDNAGNQQLDVAGDYCSQTINVYDRHPVVVDCDGENKVFVADDECKMVGLLDSLPSPSAVIYSCINNADVVVPVSSYTLGGVAYSFCCPYLEEQSAISPFV